MIHHSRGELCRARFVWSGMRQIKRVTVTLGTCAVILTTMSAASAYAAPANLASVQPILQGILAFARRMLL